MFKIFWHFTEGMRRGLRTLLHYKCSSRFPWTDLMKWQRRFALQRCCICKEVDRFVQQRVRMYIQCCCPSHASACANTGSGPYQQKVCLEELGVVAWQRLEAACAAQEVGGACCRWGVARIPSKWAGWSMVNLTKRNECSRELGLMCAEVKPAGQEVKIVFYWRDQCDPSGWNGN